MNLFAGMDRFTATVTSPHPHQWVVAFLGDLDLGSVDRAQALIDTLLYPGALLVLDLVGLAFADSSGLRVLLRAQGWATQRGASVRLASPASALRHYFDRTGVTDHFDIRPDVPAALRTARPDPHLHSPTAR